MSELNIIQMNCYIITERIPHMLSYVTVMDVL